MPRVKKLVEQFQTQSPCQHTAAPLTGEGGPDRPFEEKCTSETCFQKMLLRVLFLTRGK